MPIVERYETGQVRLQQQAQPTPSAAAPARVGAAIAQFGEAVEQAGVEHDILIAKQADTDFRNKLLEAGMGENGYYRRNGVDAVENFESFRKSIEETKREQLAGLSVGARTVIGRAIERQAQAELERGYAHYLKQLDVAQDSATAGSVASAANYAAAHWDNDEVVLNALTEIGTQLEDMYTRQGLAKEDIDARVLAEQSKLVEMMASTAQQFGPAEFEKVYAKYGVFLDAATRTKIESKLVEMKVASASYTVAEAAFAAGGSAAEQYARLDEIENSDVRKAAKASLKQLIAQDNQIRVAREREMLDSEVQRFRSDPKYTESNIPFDAPNSVYETMRRHIAARDKSLRGEKRKSKLDVLEKLSAMPQAELAEVDLNQYEPDLSEADAARFAKLIGEAQKPDPIAIGEVDRDTMMRAANAASNAMFTGQGPKNTARRQAFAYWVEKQLRGVKDPTYEDLDEIIARGAKEYVTNSDYFGDETAFGFEIETGDVVEMDSGDAALITQSLRNHLGAQTEFSDEFVRRVFEQTIQTGVPAEDVAKIYAAYREKNGRDPTDMELKAAYQQKVRRDAQ